MATRYSAGSLWNALRQFSFSRARIRREALQMSVDRFWRAARPVPVPPPLTWMVTPGRPSMKVSAHFWVRTTMVSDPLIVMLPARADSVGPDPERTTSSTHCS